VEKVDASYLGRYASSRTAIREVGDVYIRNFDYYGHCIWPEEVRKMEPVASWLNRHFSVFDVVSRWEAVTGGGLR
jgi:hypothetical protein